MQRKNQTKITLYNKDVYMVKLVDSKWSVVIMPDNIIIDNHHIAYPHIHHDPNKHYLKERIKVKDGNEVYNKVMDHVEKFKGLNLEKLIDELKK